MGTETNSNRLTVMRERIGVPKPGTNSDELIAGILIGGQSRRMGQCKALLPLRGRTFVEHVVDVASTVADEIVILGNLNLNIPGLSGIARLSDPPGCVGPLAGLSSLLEYAGSRWSLLLACDMPMLTVEVLERLIQARDESVDAVVFRRLDHECEFHVCCAAYHPRALPAVRAELSTGVGKIQNVLRAVRCTALIPAAEEEERLVNVNTPEDLASLEMRFAATAFNGLQEDSGVGAGRQ